MNNYETPEDLPQDLYLDWLEYFYYAADFGPAHGDVVAMMFKDFKESTDGQED